MNFPQRNKILTNASTTNNSNTALSNIGLGMGRYSSKTLFASPIHHEVSKPRCLTCPRPNKNFIHTKLSQGDNENDNFVDAGDKRRLPKPGIDTALQNVKRAPLIADSELGDGDVPRSIKQPVIGDRRWLYTNPNGISSNPKMHMDSIQIQPKIGLVRGRSPSQMPVTNRNTAPPMSGNGLGCDIMNQISEISDGLYLCGARAMKVQRLMELSITAVVNVTVELPCLNIETIESIKIQLDDSPYANLSYYFDRVADKIEEVRRKGGRIVVHCVAGVSRSATLVIAYLMKYKKMSLRQAYSYVKARRPIIRPNVGFFRQLVDYESRILGSTSVKMVWNAAAGGYIPDVYEPEYNNTMLFLKKYGLQTDRLGRCGGDRYRDRQ